MLQALGDGTQLPLMAPPQAAFSLPGSIVGPTLNGPLPMLTNVNGGALPQPASSAEQQQQQQQQNVQQPGPGEEVNDGQQAGRGAAGAVDDDDEDDYRFEDFHQELLRPWGFNDLNTAHQADQA